MELVAWWVKHHSLRLHVLFNRKNNNNNIDQAVINAFKLIKTKETWKSHLEFRRDLYAKLLIFLNYKKTMLSNETLLTRCNRTSLVIVEVSR